MLKGAFPAETGIKWNDYVLANKLKDELEKQQTFPRKKLLIFQLYGSHFPYGGRCEEEVMKLFDSKDYSIRVNQYDASIYETDSLINQLRELLTQVSKPVWLLYLSDHGETPDSSINRNPNCKETWQIPFVFWFNEAFRTKHAVRVKNIEAARHTEFQSDVTFDIVCSLMGVSFKRFKSENLPFASNYKPRELHFPNGITKLELLR